MDGNPLHTSWHDPAWAHGVGLSAQTVLDYFCERTNPFYDRTCNNEVLKMQRASPDQLPGMQGVEYCLLYAQEPILYVIRKQQRHSPAHVVPMADYYVVAGVVYQTPDLSSIVGSRVLSAVTHLQSAFEEARSYARYHPSTGYRWDFNPSSTSSASLAPVAKGLSLAGNRRAGSSGPSGNQQQATRTAAPSLAAPAAAAAAAAESGGDRRPKKTKSGVKGRGGTKSRASNPAAAPEFSSAFQRKRVDALLDLWVRKFPPRSAANQPHHHHQQQSAPINNSNGRSTGGEAATVKAEDGVNVVKSEKDKENNHGEDHVSPRPASQAGSGRGVKREAPTPGSTSKPEQAAKRSKNS